MKVKNHKILVILVQFTRLKSGIKFEKMDFWVFGGSFFTPKNIFFQNFKISNSKIDPYEVIKKEIIKLSQFCHTQLNP